MTHLGIFMFKVLMMGTPPASAECHTAITRMLVGLKGVIQIKDDNLVHVKGKEHTSTSERFSRDSMNTVSDSGRRSASSGSRRCCGLGTLSLNIQQCPVPANKNGVKLFLQMVQFCSPYMFKEGGETHSDVTAPLRHLIKWISTMVTHVLVLNTTALQKPFRN